VQGVDSMAFAGENQDAQLRVVMANGHESVRESAKIFAFSLDNTGHEGITVTPLFSNDRKFNRYPNLIQPADILTTVVSEYWHCPALAAQTLLGKNIYRDERASGLNYSDGVFITYKKDRITLVHADGSYKNLSAAQGFTVEQKLDVPFLIQSIKQLKSFTPH